MDEVSLKLEEVLLRVEGKSLEQKYGYLQAAYNDLDIYYEAELEEACSSLHEAIKEIAALKFLVREMVREWGECLPSPSTNQAVSIYNQFLNRPEVKAIMEGKDVSGR